MDNIVSKIQKVLELGRRGGTEAEAETAMRKAHELLAKHNLSMEDVEEKEVEDEEYTIDIKEVAPKRNSWKDLVFRSIAGLYFCDSFKLQGRRAKFRRGIIGKPSNIAIVKTVASYIIKTGERLALEYSPFPEFRDSFRKGFANRISSRVCTELERARTGGIIDSDTGTALILHPLYNKTHNEIAIFKQEAGLEFTEAKARPFTVFSHAYEAGQSAGETVSLRSNLLENK